MHRVSKIGESRFLGSSEIPYPVKRFPNSTLYFDQIPYPVKRFPNPALYFDKISYPGNNLSQGDPFFVPFHLVSLYKVGSEPPALHQENTATLRNRLHHSSWRQTERANVSHEYTLVHEISDSNTWSLAILNELKLEAALTQITKLSRFQEIKLLGVHSKVIYNINILV